MFFVDFLCALFKQIAYEGSAQMAEKNVHTDGTPFSQIIRKRSTENRPKFVTTPKVNALGQFVEKKNHLTTKTEYGRPGNDPGLVIIFNQEKFLKHEDDRFGSTRDANEIITTFSRLAFNILPECIFSDLTRDEIFSHIAEILENEDLLKKVNSVIVFFLSHGDSKNLLKARDISFNVEDILKLFGESQTLLGKPKMFVIQACKGNDYLNVSPTKTKHETSESRDESELIPMKFFENGAFPDMIVVCSTLEGMVSYRDPLKGTWYIQELCKNLTAYGRRDHIINILLRVTKCVCTNYFEEFKTNTRKQLPIFISTLTKKFYLNKNKDRSLVIQVQNDQEKIIEQLKNCLENARKVD